MLAVSFNMLSVNVCDRRKSVIVKLIMHWKDDGATHALFQVADYSFIDSVVKHEVALLHTGKIL